MSHNQKLMLLKETSKKKKKRKKVLSLKKIKTTLNKMKEMKMETPYSLSTLTSVQEELRE